MDILMVTPELAPYARATRAGDVVAALAKALCQLDHRVTVAIPKYPGFDASGLLAARRLTPLKLERGGHVTVLDGQLPTGPSLVLFDAPALFDRPSVYGPSYGAERALEGEFPDNAERFGFLCEAAHALVKQRAERAPFDVVHLHDWAGAALAVSLGDVVPHVPTVLTIHDPRHRGIVTPSELHRFGLSESAGDGAEGSGVSVLALGARAADAVTAVSTTVAQDLVDEGRFGALARALAARDVPVTGIPSGLDYALYNPATDVALKSRYDAEDPSNKGSSKTELLRSRQLELAGERPLVAAVLSGDANGAALLEGAAESLLKNDLALFVLVRGEARLERLEALRKDLGERLVVEYSADEAVVRRVCAAADIVALPSLYAATATLARTAQRYGALPVARATGAHVDAIVDCDAALETGTGFLFDEATPEAFAGAVARALSAYASTRWPALRRRVMRLDLAWDRPARRYAQVYRQAMAARAKKDG